MSAPVGDILPLNLDPCNLIIESESWNAPPAAKDDALV